MKFYYKEGGTCDANSIPCKLRPQSLQDEDISGKNSIIHKTLSSLGLNSYTKDINKKIKPESLTENVSNLSELYNVNENNSISYVDGCCSGLTMDLLMELMKDLNFDVEMYEVKDGFWGAWTVSYRIYNNDNIIVNFIICFSLQILSPKLKDTVSTSYNQKL